MLRRPLTSISRFVTSDVLGLPPNSLLRRYMDICFVFLLSGGLHVVVDIVQGIPSKESGALLFFGLVPLGLMIEDGMKTLWKSLSSRDDGVNSEQNAPRSWWQRILGLVWAMAWLGITSTWYFYPQMVRPQNQTLVPFSIADIVGLPVVIAGVIVGGSILALRFQPEI